MRPNNPNKRLRGRNRSKNSNPLARSYESNGPDVKVRGSAMQVADKYAQLARDAQSAGDRIMAENYLQHAEHYYRIVASAYEQSGQGQNGPPRERREEGNRFDDRSFRGEQPSINGFDGLEEDDEGLRRAVRSNGAVANGSQPHSETNIDDDREAERAPAGNGSGNGAARLEEASVASEQPVIDQGEAEPSPLAAAQSDGEAEGEAEKPKRRRAPRTRTRTRRAEGAAETPAPAAPEANEPTN